MPTLRTKFFISPTSLVLSFVNCFRSLSSPRNLYQSNAKMAKLQELRNIVPAAFFSVLLLSILFMENQVVIAQYFPSMFQQGSPGSQSVPGLFPVLGGTDGKNNANNIGGGWPFYGGLMPQQQSSPSQGGSPHRQDQSQQSPFGNPFFGGFPGFTNPWFNPQQQIKSPPYQPQSQDQSPTYQQQPQAQPPVYQQPQAQPPAYQQQPQAQPPAYQQQPQAQPPTYQQQPQAQPPAYQQQPQAQPPTYQQQPQAQPPTYQQPQAQPYSPVFQQPTQQQDQSPPYQQPAQSIQPSAYQQPQQQQQQQFQNPSYPPTARQPQPAYVNPSSYPSTASQPPVPSPTYQNPGPPQQQSYPINSQWNPQSPPLAPVGSQIPPKLDDGQYRPESYKPVPPNSEYAQNQPTLNVNGEPYGQNEPQVTTVDEAPIVGDVRNNPPKDEGPSQQLLPVAGSAPGQGWVYPDDS